MILLQLIRYENAPSLEATWGEIIPQPDRQIPAVLDAAGNEIEPARTAPVEPVVIVHRCHAYSNAQMAELAADLGDDAPQYQALMDEVAATCTPPSSEPVPVPASVTMRQARLALLEAGNLGAITSAIAGLPEPERSKAQIEWEYSNEVQRHNGFVSQIGPALGMSAAALDALFVKAATL